MGKYYEHLSGEERGAIMALTLAGESLRAIAEALDRSASTISRERRRNGWKSAAERGVMGRPAIAGGYDASRAQARAKRLRRKPRCPRKLGREQPLWRRVRHDLEQGWSPEQIAGRLKKDYPDRPDCHVSHETIYTAIYAPPGENSAESWSPCCARAAAPANRAPGVPTGAANCPISPAFICAHRPPTNAWCRAIGRVISSRERPIGAQSAPWWTG